MLAAAQPVGNTVCEAGLRNKGHLATNESNLHRIYIVLIWLGH